MSAIEMLKKNEIDRRTKFIIAITGEKSRLNPDSFHSKLFFKLCGGENVTTVSNNESRKAKIRQLCHGAYEIGACLDRLEQIEVFIKNYENCPTFRRKGISKIAYLTYHVEKYLEENYVLKERLMRYLKILKKYYRKDTLRYEKIEGLINRINRAFDGIVKTRGTHIHEERFADKDINNIQLADSTLNVMKILGKVNSSIRAESRLFEKNLLEASRYLTKQWQVKIRSNNKNLKKLVDVYFGSIHTIVFDKQGFIDG